MTKAQAETADGRRKLSPEHRAHLSAKAKAQWARMTPAEREAAMARIGRKPKGSAKVDPPAPGDPPPVAGGRPNPLAMTPLELVRHLRGRGQPDG